MKTALVITPQTQVQVNHFGRTWTDSVENLGLHPVHITELAKNGNLWIGLMEYKLV